MMGKPLFGRSVRWVLGGLVLFAAGVAGQGVGPAAGPSVGRGGLALRLASEGRRLLRVEDLVEARSVFRRLRALAPGDFEGLLGLGEVHLKLGQAEIARLYAVAARRSHPESDAAAALMVGSLLRLRRFGAAVDASQLALAELPEAGADLWAAHASALFRVQRTDEAAAAYRKVLELDPLHAEAHVRLGSGLSHESSAAPPSAALMRAVTLLTAGDLDRAVLTLSAVVHQDPGHPVAHRLLGDALLRRHALASMAATAPEFAELAATLPVLEIGEAVVSKFMPAWPDLSSSRRRVAARALTLFESQLPKLVVMGGKHDLLLELERTTADPARASLRGKRTFDGRLWDDVRGIGGLRAATGIEALDEVELFGFDTLAHEIAHQAHLYAFKRVRRLQITALYRAAKAGDKFLDYYAANNEAEYFGQGVEAFASYGKRPGRETTHGHTRFELYRVDRELHDLIAAVVDYDPLQDPALRGRILSAAVEVALRAGRPADAVVAAEMMRAGEQRKALLASARHAMAVARSY